MSDSYPCVSVVMPVYNGEKYLREAVESILAQTYRDFELIAIDDGSTDDSPAILESFRERDERITILTHSKNQGIVSALNRGLKMAQGKYIARMDADDFSLPERFERQVEFLKAHPQVGILGGDAIFINSQGQEIALMTHERDDLSLRWMSLLANIFFHPTVMIRRAVLTDYSLDYQPGFQSVEDYDFWVRLLEHTQGGNLDRPLVRYRVHAESVSSQSKQEQTQKHNQISYAYIKRILPEIRFTPDEHATLVATFTGRISSSQYRLHPVLARRYLELWRAFAARHHGNPALKHIKHEVVILAGKIGLYPPFEPGWLETLRCLFAEDPLWIFYFVVKIPHMIRIKLLGMHLKHLRWTSQID